jgi:hypothetical protein
MAGSPNPEFQEECKVYEGDDALRRLAEMGLRAEFLTDSATRGNERRARCTPHHPRSYPGQVMWAETLAALRIKLLDRREKWKIGNKQNYETVFHGGHCVAIAVVGGDDNTGVRGPVHPMTARPRGPVTNKRVRHNLAVGQLPLPGVPIPEAKPITDEDCITWFFLINARENKLYGELSLPIVGSRKRITNWAERIILSPLELVGAVTPIEQHEGSDERTIHVGRKTTL